MALVIFLRGSTVEFLPEGCESSIHTKAGTRVWQCLRRILSVYADCGALEQSSLPLREGGIRRLRLPFPLSVRSCLWPSTRRPWPPPSSLRDSRGFGAARVGSRVGCGKSLPRRRSQSLRSNVFVRDLDLVEFNRFARRLEVADGLPLYG